MKKTIGFLFLCIITITACEKDDFCTQNPVTPKLILRFYDATSRTTTKEAETLYVWVENKDSLFVDIATDSLVIPLNSNTNQTTYNLSKDGVIEQLTINYVTENEYVSRSCGFKINFSDVSLSSSNNWIIDFTTIATTLENQDAAHVQVFH
ncbi:DUF6452 family protein [Polaribacter sp. R77954]|uniref:DUF6452 family protein n=1 Tax=Polaribacter sp. R77954 TaxID=3093870 RepID=UPI0037CBD2AA